MITLLFLTGLFEELPEATLGAVVIAALIELVDFPALAELYRLYTRRLGRIYGAAARPDFIAAVAAMFGVLVFDTLPGLFIGIAVSMLLLLYRSSKPHIAELGEVPGAPGQYGDRERHPENQTPPGMVVGRVEGGLFFANADAVRKSLLADAGRPGTDAPSSSTANRCPSSTSPRRACCASSPTPSSRRACASPSPTTSARSATSSTGRPARWPSRCTRPCRPQWTR